MKAIFPRRPWNYEEESQLRAMADTMTAAQIGKVLCRGEAAIKAKASHLGVSLKKYGQACSWAKYPNIMVEAARELHDQGIGPREISQRYGVPYWAVCDWVYYKRGFGHPTNRQTSGRKEGKR